MFRYRIRRSSFRIRASSMDVLGFNKEVTPQVICNVSHCRYTASTDIEAFPVCALHDTSHVRAILEDLHKPGHYWSYERPIVLPCGPLKEEHFAPIEGEGIDPETCPRLAEIDFDCHSFVLPRFDLTKEFSRD